MLANGRCDSGSKEDDQEEQGAEGEDEIPHMLVFLSFDLFLLVNSFIKFSFLVFSWGRYLELVFNSSM